jgi:hypothetical protein
MEVSLVDRQFFFHLSAVLSYQLSARPAVDLGNILDTIFSGRKIPEMERTTFIEVLDLLQVAYGDRSRQVGGKAVLHLYRSAALLSLVSESSSLQEGVLALLHDYLEDIHPQDFSSAEWENIHLRFKSLLKNIPLEDRLELLTRRPREIYYHYIGRLLQGSWKSPEVVRIKILDRLDNTMDLHIDLWDPQKEVGFFEKILQLILFTGPKPVYQPSRPHPSSKPFNGAERLYQLFKNTVLLSIIRQDRAIFEDAETEVIFDALLEASSNEAQRIVLHLCGYHLTDTARLRSLLLDSVDYVRSGGIDHVTSPTSSHRLDGLFASCFDDASSTARKQRLKILYRDKELMLQAALCFISIFLKFQNDPGYFVRGISGEGIRPAL